MCISHGFQLFNAFWEVYTDARSGVLWLEKKKFFIFICGIYCNVNTFKSVNVLQPSS